MSEVALILTVGFAFLIIAGVPIAFAMGVATLVALWVADVDLVVLPQTIYAGTQSFTLLAIPFFILAGEVMTTGGISQRLVTIAEVLVRHVRGGLGHVVVLSAALFSALSGSAAATTAAIGFILVPELAKRGYGKAFATSLVVSAGVLGPLIPPSIASIIWAVIARVSVSRLFLATVGPALLLIIGLMIVSYVHAVRNDIPRLPRASLREIAEAFRSGIWSLMAPVIILGGIYAGVFTPTEAAVVACVYALAVGILVERRIRLNQLPSLIMRAARTSIMVMFIIAAASGFGWLVALEQLPQMAASYVIQSIQEPWLVLLAMNAFITVLCSVLDETAMMVIMGPLFIEIANQAQIDPIHLGTIIVINTAMGMAIPPIGYCIFIGMAISGLSLLEICKAIWPQIIWMFVMLMAATYIPAICMFLPKLIYG